MLTNNAGSYHERIEYLPYGETWVEDKVTSDSYTTPYKFTSKELDAETGLYYFGARYYDARVSRWVSADPALAEGKYFPKPNDYDTEHDFYWYLQQDGSKKLAGLGGVFNAVNMDVYHYAGDNPVKLVDPDGKTTIIIGIKAEVAGSVGSACYTGIAMDFSERNVYIFNNISMTAGTRADIGVDINIITRGSYQEYLDSKNTIFISGDLGYWGFGFGIIDNNGNMNFVINISGGIGAGLSVGTNKMPNKTYYMEFAKYMGFKFNLMKEEMKFKLSYILGNKEGMQKSMTNMLKIYIDFFKSFKEK